MERSVFEKYRFIANDYLISIFPQNLKPIISDYLKSYPDLSEIRVRVASPLSFTVSGATILTGCKIEQYDIDYIIDRLTEGNYYKNEDLIRQGYLTLPYSIRAGICGDVFVLNGCIKNLKAVYSVNIRIPCVLTVDVNSVIDHIINKGFNTGILFFSPPGQGKTTVLRSIISVLASNVYKKRLAVIDTNRELVLPFFNGLVTCDVLSGYPKSEGVNAAIRYLNPEYIVVDELGGRNETEALLDNMHSGVPVLASAHCGGFDELKRKNNLKILIENGVFDTFCSIKRKERGIECVFRGADEL